VVDPVAVVLLRLVSRRGGTARLLSLSSAVLAGPPPRFCRAALLLGLRSVILEPVLGAASCAASCATRLPTEWYSSAGLFLLAALILLADSRSLIASPLLADSRPAIASFLLADSSSAADSCSVAEENPGRRGPGGVGRGGLVYLARLESGPRI
jgi:hypothetical protein